MLTNTMPTEIREQHWSWVIAFACCFINCLLYGVSRLSGLLLVATVEALNVSRAKAALPYSISTSVRNLSGIFVGYLGQKFGLRPVISAGCILASMGAACCFFISDIVWISVCWGGIFGMGCGLATCLLPLAINQHFGRNRGTASGISYSGSYIGSFAFPPLVVQLLDRYGLPGTFLVISGTMLNGLAAAMLFRSPTQETPRLAHTAGIKPFQCHLSGGLRNRFKSFIQKLFQHVDIRKTVMKTTKLQATHPDIYLIAYEPFCDWNVNKKYGFPLETEIFVGDTNVLRKKSSLRFMDQTDRICSSELMFSYPIDENSNLKISPMKRECNQSAYRTKISKLREIIRLYLLRERCSFEGPSSPDSVILTSFRNLECFINSPECNVPIQSYSYWNHQQNNNHYILKDVSDILHNLEPEHQLKCGHEVPLGINENKGMGDHLKPIHLDTNSNIPLSQHNCESSRQRSDVSILCDDRNLHHNHCEVSTDPNSPSNQTTVACSNSSHSSCKRPPSKNCFSNDQFSVIKDLCKCCFGWFRMFSDPMFVVITVTMSLHTFVIVCMVTIIEDFAKDLQVPCNRVHHVIMVLSTADLIGALSLGMITDRGLISREIFMALCLFGTGISAIAISFSDTLTMLLILVAFYGLFETGVIITFPLLIAQFIREKKQPVALASSNVLSSPTVLFVPPLIGYFRDNIGCYSGVFYVLGLTSFVSSCIWLMAPYVVKRYRKKRQLETQTVSC